ncbi:hypothetical protein DFH09DRAFT_1092690 [Mycena vulgaris]|nr:hypothetical protein DFH09DRAFT_1092690 [Mycena vulgaris]
MAATAAPFGVHRMALAGKAAGKDVGMWFGPSTTAGALRTLVDAYAVCGLAVSVAIDGTLVARTREAGDESVGDRPVLLLPGIQLGLDGVNPVYHETIKVYAVTFSLSVGIAGGRPSLSYYFVGVQGNGYFYLDPHHSRPAVPLRPFIDESAPPPAHGTHAHDYRRSLSPEADTCGGSLSSDLPRGVHGQGQGHRPMTEDELIYTPSRSRSASADPASGAPSSHPCTDSGFRPNSASHTTPGLPIYEAGDARAPPPAFPIPPISLPSTVVLFSAVSAPAWWRGIAFAAFGALRRAARFLFFSLLTRRIS